MYGKASTIRDMADQVKLSTVGIILAATTLVVGGGAWGASAAGFFERPAPTPTSVVQEETTPTPTPTVTPTPTPTPTVEQVVEEVPVEEAPVDEAPYYGEPVPWIADPNPNSAEGGYWDTTQCPTSSAHQGPDGNQYCD